MKGTPKYRADKPESCRYCYWWNNRKKKCEREQCKYLIAPKRKKKDSVTKHGDCRYCPYGKHAPCLGYCIAKLRREVNSRL